ncbi:MAG: glycosyltransferase family 4 protein [Candidatus Eremiobacteraeota bacterium]|nr:glycosyltransferase family 4 protein [Candidatus Eremiobacteraeota bacterium]
MTHTGPRVLPPRRLLMLNWRDPWHPAAGGAEVLTHRILQRLVDDYGWQAEWFSAAYPGASSDELRDGIRYVRQGRQATVHLRAYSRYRGTSEYDVVVDQTNTIPFWTPLYARAPMTLLNYQLAREVWLYEAPPLLREIGYLTEPLLLRPYRDVPVMTISQSTADSLRDMGLRGEITIVPVCVDEPGDDEMPAKTGDDIVVLGRLVPSKRVEESIRAAALLRELGWSGTLHLVGGGPAKHRASLEALAASLHANAIFHGRISNEDRTALLRSARLLWMTSVREGWGLVITEAGRHWTPAVVYDSPGLRDAVLHERSGLVVAPDHRVLATATKQLFEDRPRLERYAQGARSFSSELTLDRTVEAFVHGVDVAIGAAGRR